MLGLAELLLVLLGAIVWGVYKLWSVRRGSGKQGRRASKDKGRP